MERYFQDIGIWDTYRSHDSTVMLRLGPICKAFVRTLDDVAREKRRSLYWLEKTPRHLHYLSDIEEFVPRVHVIHLLRRGEDTVASLYHAKNTYPEEWGGPASIEECCKRWERDIEISLDYHGKPGHTLVTYEEITTRTEVVLRNLTSDIGFEYEASMISGRAQASENVIRENEEWKKKVEEEVKPSRSEKFQSVFEPREQNKISQYVSNMNRAIQNLQCKV